MSVADWQLLVEMEAIAEPIAGLARIEVQRSDLVASELIVLLKAASDSLNRAKFPLCDLDVQRTVKLNEKTFPRRPVVLESLSTLGSTCLKRFQHQVQKRVASLNTTAEAVVILMLDPRTKSAVEALITSPELVSSATDTAKSGSDCDAQGEGESSILAAGKELLKLAHREVFRAMFEGASHENEKSAQSFVPNLDLVPSIDDSSILCGAPVVVTTTPSVSESSFDAQADEVLARWLQYSVQWVPVAMHQAQSDDVTEEELTQKLLMRRGGVVCWRLEALCKHIDICRWFRETGCAQFPSIAALARVWLGRSPSNAVQERVFSTGGFVMSSLRTRTENERAEMQVLMKFNRAEIQGMESAQVDSATHDNSPVV